MLFITSPLGRGADPDTGAMPDRDPPPGVAEGDRRAGKRHASVLLIGKVVQARGDAACLVHDISKSGMMARFTEPRAVGETLRIEVRGLPAVEGTVRWVNGCKAGLQFASTQDVEEVFHLRRRDGTVARAPRFPLAAAARLRFDDRRLAGTAVDISPGGAKVEVADPVVTGMTGQLLLTATGTSLYGTVCWTREGRCGFRFVTPLPLATLAEIIGG